MMRSGWRLCMLRRSSLQVLYCLSAFAVMRAMTTGNDGHSRFTNDNIASWKDSTFLLELLNVMKMVD